MPFLPTTFARCMITRVCGANAVARNVFTNRNNMMMIYQPSTVKLFCRSNSNSAFPRPAPRRWLWAAVPTGLVCFGLVISRTQSEAEEDAPRLAKDWEVTLYRKLPLRSLSRAWGRFNDLDLPEWSRKPLLSIYIRLFACNVGEAAVEDLKYYKNLGEFFRRSLKPGVRPIDSEHSLVMPSDGKVLNYGVADKGSIEQVKGVTYCLKQFLGPNSSEVLQEAYTGQLSELEVDGKLKELDQQHETVNDTQYYKSILHNKENRLHHIVIYLAPGDYHRFHSPTDWVVEHRRHFPGELLSVNPMIARWVQGLFGMNERAVYTGTWKHGFFSMTAVGATNVGSIRTYFDEALKTNVRTQSSKQQVYYDRPFREGVLLRKGELFGEFNLGSTIVLVFEAPPHFRFTDVAVNKSVRMGEALGDKKHEHSATAQA